MASLPYKGKRVTSTRSFAIDAEASESEAKIMPADGHKRCHSVRASGTPNFRQLLQSIAERLFVGNSAENTTIVSGAGKKSEIQARIAQIKAQIEETTL